MRVHSSPSYSFVSPPSISISLLSPPFSLPLSLSPLSPSSLPPSHNLHMQVCTICAEQFEQFWEEELEEWHFREAIRHEGKVVSTQWLFLYIIHLQYILHVCLTFLSTCTMNYAKLRCFCTAHVLWQKKTFPLVKESHINSVCCLFTGVCGTSHVSCTELTHLVCLAVLDNRLVLRSYARRYGAYCKSCAVPHSVTSELLRSNFACRGVC